MPLDPKRKGDIKVIAGATVARPPRRPLHLRRHDRHDERRIEPDLRAAQHRAAPPACATNLENGPYFQTGGGDCGFCLALENGDIVAYKVGAAVGLHAATGSSTTGSAAAAPIAASELAQYPVSIQTAATVSTRSSSNLGTARADATSTTSRRRLLRRSDACQRRPHEQAGASRRRRGSARWPRPCRRCLRCRRSRLRRIARGSRRRRRASRSARRRARRPPTVRSGARSPAAVWRRIAAATTESRWRPRPLPRFSCFADRPSSARRGSRRGTGSAAGSRSSRTSCGSTRGTGRAVARRG